MAYPRRLLNPDEEVVIDRHPHWSYMLGPIVMISMGVVALAVIVVLLPAFWWVGALVIVVALLGSVAQYLRWQNIDFVVTTDRVIVRTGILSKSGLEIPLDRIMNISYRQALWQRMLATGDLVIESAGEGGHQPFTHVSQPAKVQNIIYRQSEIYQGRGGPLAGDGLGGGAHGQATSARQLSIPEQIEKLADLWQRGIVSDDEFEQKKQALLDRM